MLNSLKIKNYRNLEDLEIKSLGRVNLITGKNNTGKSSVLEDYSEFHLDSFKTLFFNQKYQSQKISLESSNSENLEISIRYQQTIENKIDNEPKYSIKSIKKESEIDPNLPLELRLVIKKGDKSSNISLNDKILNRYSPFEQSVSYQFIKSGLINNTESGELWDSITLTENEKYVIDVLKLIESHVKRLAFVQQHNNIRSAKVKLKNIEDAISIRMMGDGINRNLTIILALINCKDGYCLIDEFENGIHYTVQEKLWKIIFHLAHELNIQVFSTTHSSDCIRAFENVVNEDSKNQDSQLIRLDMIGEKVHAINIDAENLKIATDHLIEIR